MLPRMEWIGLTYVERQVPIALECHFNTFTLIVRIIGSLLARLEFVTSWEIASEITCVILYFSLCTY